MKKFYFKSPIGKLLIAMKNNKLSGLYMEGQKNLPKEFEDFSSDYPTFSVMKSNDDNKQLSPTQKEVVDWLDKYFSGEKQSTDDFSQVKFEFKGTTFQKKVWKELLNIPYGQTISYSKLAENIFGTEKANSMSRAVANAVGHNPISIIVPCHRVVGKNGSLTGYAGGLKNKLYLLKLEGILFKNDLIAH